MEYDNELRGAMWKNDRKRPDKRDPDYTGNCQIGGVEFYVDSWISEPKAGGKKFLSLRFKEKQPKAQAPATAPAEPEPFIDDDVPF